MDRDQAHANMYGDIIHGNGHRPLPQFVQTDHFHGRRDYKGEDFNDKLLGRRDRLVEPVIDKILNDERATKRIHTGHTEWDPQDAQSPESDSKSMIDDPSENEPVTQQLAQINQPERKVVDIQLEIYPGRGEEDRDGQSQGQSENDFDDLFVC